MDKETNQTPIRATIPVPDHSDLRGFSYRGPVSEDHPENNQHFEIHAEEEDPDLLAQEKAEMVGDEIDPKKAELADLNPDDFEEQNDLGAGPGANPTMTAADEDADLEDDRPSRNVAEPVEDDEPGQDVLEEVRGGLRADVPDDQEYDDTDANARRRAS